MSHNSPASRVCRRFRSRERHSGIRATLEVRPGGILSLQLHHRRSEHWVVVSGEARVTNGEHVYTIRTNESTFIPQETRHRLENPGLEALVMIEVQCGSYVGEDDIVRFDDQYGRVRT